MTVSREVRTFISLFKDRLLIGWKSSGGPGWDRFTESGHIWMETLQHISFYDFISLT